MEQTRESLTHLFRDLVALFGRTGAETLIAFCLLALIIVAGFATLWCYLILRFGHSSLKDSFEFVLQAFKTFRYQPRQLTHPSIRLELYFDAVLGIVILVALVGFAAHALVPWMKEHTENLLFATFISALVIFSILAYVSIKMAAHFPHD